MIQRFIGNGCKTVGLPFHQFVHNRIKRDDADNDQQYEDPVALNEYLMDRIRVNVKGGGKLCHVGGTIVGLRRRNTVPSAVCWLATQKVFGY